LRKPLRICMIPGSTDGVNYYRLATWAYEMRKYRNVHVDLLWFKYEIDPSKPHSWQEDFTSDEPYERYPFISQGEYIRKTIEHFCEVSDVIIWHPVYYGHIYDFFIEMQHKYEKKFVVECDDNYMDVPSWNEAFKSFSPGTGYRRFAIDCMRNSDAVVVTTPHLQDAYSQFNDNVFLLENSLDFKGDRKFIGWDRVSPRKHKGIRLGWIGGRTHFDDLMMVAPALREVLLKHPEVSLTLVNSAFDLSCEALGRKNPLEGLKNVLYVNRSVAINRYAPFMASFGFDVGLAPLVDCNFNRSKSNLRWLEYSALGIPSVCSEVSHYSKTVRNGIDGILIKDNDLQKWQEALDLLIMDQPLREQIGRAAAKRVRRDFNVKHNAPKYARWLKALAKSSAIDFETEEAVAV